MIPADRVGWIGDHISVHPVPIAMPGLIGLARWAGVPLLVFSLETLMGWGSGPVRERMTLVVIEEAGKRNPVRVYVAVDEVVEVLSAGQGGDPSEPVTIMLGGQPRLAHWFPDTVVFEDAVRSDRLDVPNPGPGD